METENSPTKDFFLTGGVSDSFNVPLKDRFKVLLRRKGLSQNELSNLIGISKGTMSKIVNGSWYPSTQIMVLISRELEIDSSVLFGDNPLWKMFHDKIVYPKEVEEKNGN